MYISSYFYILGARFSDIKVSDYPDNYPDLNAIESDCHTMGTEISEKSLLLWLNCRKVLVGFEIMNSVKNT